MRESGARPGAAAGQSAPPQPGMVWIPDGTYLMESDQHYPEEAPAHLVTVEGFWMDAHTVTSAEFARFVEETGYVTVAERPLGPAAYPDADPDLLVPGALVFQRQTHQVDLRDATQWWAYVPGANWRHPDGPQSDLTGRERHPVTQVAYEDAEAYANWAGKRLPSEAECERAARGGLHGAAYVWGDEFLPGRRLMANVWIGQFPWQMLRPDQHIGTMSVESFPPNGYGLLTWRATSGSGPATGMRHATRARTRIRTRIHMRIHMQPPSMPVARQRIHAERRARRATIPRSRRCASRAKSSRVARTCARRTTACATAPPPAHRRWWIPRPPTSASAASSDHKPV
jgi:hypothetical protein